MGDFKRGGSRGGGFNGGDRGGRPSFPKKSFGGDRDARDVQMHQATCSDCGKRCEVPFRPTGDKPVFCNDCFAKKRDNDDRGGRPQFNTREPRNNFNDRFNDHAPRKDFEPRATPKSYDAPKNNDNSEIKKQLEMLNVKMDRLIQTLSNTNTSKTVVEPKKTIENKEVKTVEVAKKTTKAAPVKKAAPAKILVKIPAKTAKKTVVTKKPILKKKK